jgi:cobalt-zinc-cadmium efflux system protein
MGHHHEHSHHHNHHNHSKEINNIKILLIAFSLTFIFMVIEFIGGFFSKSLALISDAGHMLSDVASMGIAIWAINQGTKNSTLSKTFGYKRTEVIAAFVNGITLVTISLLILKEGIERLLNPIQINQEQLIIIALYWITCKYFSSRYFI